MADSRKMILLVDDQKDLLLIMEREFCRREDLKVVSASNIGEAMTILDQNPIQLVISDLRLGTESGFTLARTLLDQHPDVGIILMSAYRSSGNREQAVALGAAAFLEKPFTMSKLMHEVDTFFVHQAERVVAAAAMQREQMHPSALATGSMNHFQIQDLVQLFCLNGRAVMISIRGELAGETGCIYIQHGQVLHAEMDGMTGEEAFQALLALPGPKLAVKDWDRPVAQTITAKWEHLLITAAVKSDEEGYDTYTDSQVG